MKDCSAMEEMLSAHLDGELSGADLKKVQGHLAGCNDCQRVMDDYRKVGGLLKKENTLEVARTDFGMLRERVRWRLLKSKPRTVWGVKRFNWHLATVLGLVVAVLVIWLRPEPLEVPVAPSLRAGSVQEELGLALRDAAHLQYTARQVSSRHQEQLGQLIRDDSRSSIQEQMGQLIRDHAHSQWTIHQQSGKIQERLGHLIVSQNRPPKKI